MDIKRQEKRFLLYGKAVSVHYRLFMAIAGIVAMLLIFGASALPVVGMPAQASTTFAPVADAYVASDNASSNYGSLTTLRGDASPVVNSYLRFSVQGLSGTVTRATLQIYANSSSSSGYDIHRESNNSWVEGSITYSNAPSIGSVLGSSGAFSSGSWTSVDVTPYITGNATYSLVLTQSSSTAVSFASREAGGNAPKLVVETGSSSAPTPTSSSSSSAVLVGAGDISTCSNNNDEATAKLLDGISGTVFTVGDNAYSSGSLSQYNNCYDPTWGRAKSRTKPVPGNHEYQTSGASGYFQYFNGISSYYAYNLGSWRIYALNSEISVSSTSAQMTWLKNDLAAHPTACTLAYWHEPRWSSGSTHGSNSGMQTLWQVLYNAGAELVINGHEHNYERFAQMNASGAAVSSGLREIVVGTGGVDHYSFGSILSASQIRNSSTYGVLKLTLSSGSYSWKFVPIAGSSFTDSGSSNCH